MSGLATGATIDPLAALLARSAGGDRRPVPLVSTVIDVRIDSGLAVVRTQRRFRNVEEQSIEASITFPVPVHAVLYELEAAIDGRVLRARAQPRQRARATYEAAIDAGRTGILHEELLRGIHMLSVGQLGPGAEIEVSFAWVMALSREGGVGRLRIPQTVGDVYGRSGLPDSDELVHGGAAQLASLTVTCRGATVRLRGADLAEGRAQVPTDTPIDLEVGPMTAGELRGHAADGRGITLRIAEAPAGDDSLDLAILVDRSGSMREVCDASLPNVSKHRVLLDGLRAVAAGLRASDRIDLWEFDDELVHVGDTRIAGEKFYGLVDRLNAPEGDTEIGVALAGVAAASSARDILLITDGKSHTIDVQALARTGRRMSVVLVGEDSLEANVGYLASLSGGDIFVATGLGQVVALDTALRSLRAPFVPPAPLQMPLAALSTVRGRARIDAHWSATVATDSDSWSRAVGAFAAGLALGRLGEAEAAALAESEGLVTHLTSLVIVDEAGAVQATVPATRKVPLPTPATLGALYNRVSLSIPAACAPPRAASAGPRLLQNFTHGRARAVTVEQRDLSRAAPPEPPASAPAATRRPASASRPGTVSSRSFAPPPPVPSMLASLSEAAGSNYAWETEPEQLMGGDLSGVPPRNADAIRRAASLTRCVALAQQVGVSPISLIVALIAHSQSARSRVAARIARKFHEKVMAAGPNALRDLNDLARSLGLKPF